VKTISRFLRLAGALLFLSPALLSIARAQLYTSSRSFTIVATNSANVFTAGNTGVAIQALFEFDQALGYLRLTLTNLSGTGSYTPGVLMGGGFDGPVGLIYKAGSFTTESISAGEPGGVDFLVGNGFSFGGLGANGSFDFGAGTNGPDGNGGGDPADGLAGGYTAALRFQFEGDLTNFNATQFFATNGTDADMGFRFQSVGANGQNSEKLAYVVVDQTPPIPEPSTYGLIGAGTLLALVGVSRLRQRKNV
jgi:hypothetical protein